jgi:hypothetical protein
MSPAAATLSDKSRLAGLLEHFATIDDPRDVRRITHPLAEILLLVVCGTIAWARHNWISCAVTCLTRTASRVAAG